MLIQPGLFIGPKTVTCLFHGAPNETLTLTNMSNGATLTVGPLNAHGISENYTAMDSGVWAIYGSQSGYSRVRLIGEDGTYDAYPEGTIYWYGNGDTEGDSLWDICGGFTNSKGIVSKNSNSIVGGYTMSASASDYYYSHSHSCPSSAGSKYGSSVFSANSFPLADYSRFLLDLYTSSTSDSKWGIPTSKSSRWSPDYTPASTTHTFNTVDVSSVSTDRYIGACVFDVTNGNTSETVRIHAAYRDKGISDSSSGSWLLKNGRLNEKMVEGFLHQVLFLLVYLILKQLRLEIIRAILQVMQQI